MQQLPAKRLRLLHVGPTPADKAVSQIPDAVLPQFLFVKDLFRGCAVSELGVKVLQLAVKLTHYTPSPTGRRPPKVSPANESVGISEAVLKLGLLEAEVMEGRPAVRLTG